MVDQIFVNYFIFTIITRTIITQMERVETNFVHETILSAINHKPQRLLAVIL